MFGTQELVKHTKMFEGRASNKNKFHREFFNLSQILIQSQYS